MQYHDPSISLAFYGALRRIAYLLRCPAPKFFLEPQHPQSQAVTHLTWLATEEDIPVPYRVLDANELLKYPNSWAIFQLFESIQLRHAWRRNEVPEVEEHDIRDAFGAVGHLDAKTPFFPEGNISPAARRILLRRPGFLPKIDWAVRLATEPDGEVFATLHHKSVDPFRMSVGRDVWLNPESSIWEVAP